MPDLLAVVLVVVLSLTGVVLVLKLWGQYGPVPHEIRCSWGPWEPMRDDVATMPTTDGRVFRAARDVRVCKVCTRKDFRYRMEERVTAAR